MINDKFDSEIIKAVHEIHAKLEGRVVFAGSFGLKYYGLLDRLIKDLDVFTEHWYYGTEEAVTELNRISSGKFYVNGKEVLCVHGETSNGIQVDYFYKHKEPLEFNLVDFHGVEIKIEDPKFAIQAKEQYAKNNSQDAFNIQKHKDDLLYIYGLQDEPYESTVDDLPF